MNIIKVSLDAGIVEPKTPIEIPSIPPQSLVVFGGRAPIWRYAMAFHMVHGKAVAIGVYDPRLGGAVIVASHSREVSEGDVVPMSWDG